MGSNAQISFPKIRKAVHKIMLKYGKNKFYRKIDWIEKVLKRLRVKSSPKIKARIRNHINRWLSANSEIVDTKGDSKKGVLDSTNNKDHSEEKENEDSSDNKEEQNHRQTRVQDKVQILQRVTTSKPNEQEQKILEPKEQVQVGILKPNSSNGSIPPMPQAIPIKQLKERISLIDLTFDPQKEESNVEVITIDDEIEIIEETIVPQQPLILLEQPCARPDYLHYNYGLNDYYFYPAIVQPHIADF